MDIEILLSPNGWILQTDIEVTAILVAVLIIILVTLLIISLVSTSEVIDDGLKSGMITATTFISLIIIGSLIITYGYVNLERGR